MISVFVPCPACRGIGYHAGGETCASCQRIGRVWAAGAPSYSCAATLADRDPGEIVTLGNGDHGKILWHMPRKRKKVRPETTFMGLIDEFTGIESYKPVAYPSCVGVLSVDFTRGPVDREAHDRERDIDYNDPVHRQVAGRLL